MALALFVILVLASIALASALIRRVAQDSRRGALIMLAVVAAIPGIPLLGAAAAYLANEWRLAQFAGQLYKFPSPPGARVLSRHAQVGLLTGNGDHCDFVVSQELAAELPLEAVQAHYAALSLKPAITGGASGGLPDLDVEPRVGGGYVATAIDAPYAGIFDLRCF